ATARWLLAKIIGPECGTYSSPSTFGRPSSDSKGPMKMYLKSQYHMDPPHNGAPDGALRQLYLRGVDATTGGALTLPPSQGCADSVPGRSARVHYHSARPAGAGSPAAVHQARSGLAPRSLR